MMKQKNFLIGAVACLTLGSLIVGCASTAVDSQNMINASVGETFTITLRGNPTTGYSWDATEIPAEITLTEKHYEQDKTDPMMVGVGGTFHFRFKAVKKADAAIHFEYRRPWENLPAVEVRSYRVRIR